jgi:hypothetical protein
VSGRKGRVVEEHRETNDGGWKGEEDPVGVRPRQKMPTDTTPGKFSSPPLGEPCASFPETPGMRSVHYPPARAAEDDIGGL